MGNSTNVNFQQVVGNSQDIPNGFILIPDEFKSSLPSIEDIELWINISVVCHHYTCTEIVFRTYFARIECLIIHNIFIILKNIVTLYFRKEK